MTTKHTPGPWKIVPMGCCAHGPKCLEHGLNRDEPFRIEGADRFSPCKILGDGTENTGTAEANARLIAAAPETAAERDRLKTLNTELLRVLDYIAAGDQK